MNKLVSLSLILMVLIAGCSSERQYESGASGAAVATEEPAATEPKEKLEILEHKMEYGEYGTLKIVGKAKNVGNEQISYAEIRVKFYDTEDAVIGSSLDNINDLNSEQVWKFEVMYFSMETEEVDHYDIAVGTVW